MPWPSIWPFTSSSSSDNNKSSKKQDQNQSTTSLFSPPISSTSSTTNQTPDHSLLTRLSTHPLESALLILSISASSILAYRTHQRYLSRIPTASAIPPSFYRRRTLRGLCTSVGDGDNFRLYHAPGGRLLGYFWLPGRRVRAAEANANTGTIDGPWWRPSKAGRRRLKSDDTIHVRLAGVDAPELGHWGNEAQPGAKDALEWLKRYVGGRRVSVRLLKPDQYGRVVGTAWVRKLSSLGMRRDISLEMLREGLACVYEAKAGAEFGGREEKYREAEARAKKARKGMWAVGKKEFESPRDYKTRISGKEAEKEKQKTGQESKASSATGSTMKSIWSVFFGKK
ncbi:MAG: hypothetical protein Q9227_007289 [Pyrenula ochraceoflavens]